MQVPPYWFTSRAVDRFYDADGIAEYDAIVDEYLRIYAAEEKRRNGVVKGINEASYVEKR
ncbi:hypothetical protein VCV18_007197 [Metarhizium anisopliae]